MPRVGKFVVGDQVKSAGGQYLKNQGTIGWKLTYRYRF
jgi:hypothetical protein